MSKITIILTKLPLFFGKLPSKLPLKPLLTPKITIITIFMKTLWRENAKPFFLSDQRSKNGNFGNFESYAQKKGNFNGNFVFSKW